MIGGHVGLVLDLYGDPMWPVVLEDQPLKPSGVGNLGNLLFLLRKIHSGRTPWTQETAMFYLFQLLFLV